MNMRALEILAFLIQMSSQPGIQPLHTRKDSTESQRIEHDSKQLSRASNFALCRITTSFLVDDLTLRIAIDSVVNHMKFKKCGETRHSCCFWSSGGARTVNTTYSAHDLEVLIPTA